MATTTTSVKKNQELATSVAVLEHTVTRTDERLSRIESVMTEIHNKIDASILNHSVKLAEHKAELSILKDGIDDNSKEIARVESRGTKIITWVSGLMTIVFSAVVSYFIPNK
jgi:predicted  nucleic acid-binding Zn-ribbon protein